MNTRLSLVVFAALLGLFASQALAADYCLGIPFTVKEKYCGGPIPCTLGEYCDRTSTCVPTKALGATCEEDYECSLGSFCRGPEDAKVCVAISGVGQPCTGDSSIAQADCSPYLACNQTSKKCFNGAFGDACTANADCRSGVCTGGNCDGPVGVDCNPFGTDLVCSPANYCSMIDGQCVARLAVGASCTGSSCVSTAACARSVDGNNQNRTCIAKSTVAAGGFCDGTSELCASGICYNNYCLAKPPTYCSNNGVQCSGNQMCLCGKDFLYNGYGKCASYKCMDKFTALMTCAMTQCKTDGLQTISYPNSCLSLHCKAEFDDALACNGLLLSMIGFGNGGGGDPTL